MNITLIQPRKPNNNTDADLHWQLTRPMSLFFLAASLEKYTDFNVNIIDFERNKEKTIDIEDVIYRNKSDVYGITATSYSRFEAIKLAKIIKSIHPDSIVIAGGPHFMYCAKDTLKNVQEIDVVVRGEGEVTIVQLCNSIKNNKDFKDIKGITYRDNDKIIENDEQDVFEDLDSIPIYSKFKWNDYPEYLIGYPEKIKAISIMASRGCVGRCIFCSKSGMKYRLRNPKKVVDEIQFYQEKFDIQAVNFLDLTFTASPKHVRELCKEIIDRKINIKWWCESRVNIPLDLLNTMKNAGCVSLVVGVESGSNKIINSIGKDITIDQVIKFCEKCNIVGIKVSAYFMFSHPEETKEDVEKTLNLIKSLYKYQVDSSFQPATIYPGTELERIAVDKGILKKDFSWCEPYESELNKKVGQLTNVPLYIEKLDRHDIKSFLNKKLKNDEKNQLFSNIERELELKNRYKEYYLLTTQWLKNRNNNIKISDLLLKRGITKIAIYGIGEIGEILYKEIVNSKIIIEYFIDSSKNDLRIDGISVISVEEIPLQKEVDCIVITPFYNYDEILELLLFNGYSREVVSIDDIVYI